MVNIGFMDIPELPYIIPRIVKGRSIIKVPAGSTIEKRSSQTKLVCGVLFSQCSGRAYGADQGNQEAQ